MSEDNKFINEIRSDLINQDINLSTILRKAKVLASILKNKKLKEWVNNELGGYFSNENTKLPAYRKIHLENMGHFSGPFGSGIRNALIPIGHLPEIAKKFANDSEIPDSIKSIESMVLQASKSKGTLQINWPADLVAYTQNNTTMYPGYNLVAAWKLVSSNQLEAILDNVRNKLLDFIIELEEQFPNSISSEKQLGNIPIDNVNTLVINKIYGDQTQLASGTNIHQTININVYNNIAKLQKELEKIGIPEEDIKELKLSIDKDGPLKKNTLGKKVSDWLGMITSKIYSGTLKLTDNTTASIIANLIMKYYGLLE